MLRNSRLARLSMVALAATAPAAHAAEICSVPGSHATIQSAVLDGSCTTVQLSAGTYTEAITVGRGLTLAGPAEDTTIIAGSLRIESEGGPVVLRNFDMKTACVGEAMAVLGASQVSATNVHLEKDPTLVCSEIFADGFDAGTTSAWSSVVGRGPTGPLK